MSPIETVWAIVKQELSKKKNNNLDDLRNNLIDIWSRFPNELCEKIVAEFDDKIRICQKEEGKIVNKVLMNKYSNIKKKIFKVDNEGNKKEYDWETIKRDKNIRIVYNDKIIEKVKKKIIKFILQIKKDKIKEFKKSYCSKTNNINNLDSEAKKSQKEKLKEEKDKIENNFHKLIKYIKSCTTVEFIMNMINKGLINKKKFFVNTRVSKKLNVNEDILNKIFEIYEREKYTNKKMKQIFNYINVNNSENPMSAINIEEKMDEKENECEIIDTVDLLEDLYLNVKVFRKTSEKNCENKGRRNKKYRKKNKINNNNESSEYSDNSESDSSDSSSKSNNSISSNSSD